MKNPVKSFFVIVNLAISYSKFNHIINIYSVHYSVHMRLLGEKIFILVKPNVYPLEMIITRFAGISESCF